MKPYNISQYRLSKTLMKQITRLEPQKSYLALLNAWLTLIALVAAVRFVLPTEYFWYAYVPAIFLIAGRFGVLLQMCHEGSHYLISHSKKWNNAIARWLCGFPIGVFYDGYAKTHVDHHRGTNTDQDPPADSEKYRITDFRNPKLYLLLIKDLLGMTALSIFFAYKQEKKGNEPTQSPWERLSNLCLVQTFILGALFQFHIFDYILLWILPAACPHMFLMRIRGIAEHGLAKQLGVKITSANDGTLYTRSFLTEKNTYFFKPLVWLEKALIGSLSVHYHHEHHLVPSVPFYHLRTLHKEIASQINAQNPDVYAKGYFSAALRNLTQKQTKQAKAIR